MVRREERFWPDLIIILRILSIRARLDVGLHCFILRNLGHHILFDLFLLHRERAPFLRIRQEIARASSPKEGGTQDGRGKEARRGEQRRNDDGSGTCYGVNKHD